MRHVASFQSADMSAHSKIAGRQMCMASGKRMSAAFSRKPLRPVGNENWSRVADRRDLDGFRRRRRDIFVETRIKNSQAPSGATSSEKWMEYAAPTGLEMNLVFWCYKYAAPTAL